MADRYIMRPATLDDFPALIELAKLSGAGFTSLPVNDAILQAKLEQSVKAFHSEPEDTQFGKYLMMMVQQSTSEVVGCSAVKSGTGTEHPFFNYRVITLAQASRAAGDKRFDMDALVLTNEYVGYTEVGTLFIKAEHRGGGAGRLAAQSRYLLMAAAPDQFSDRVLAELRGVIDADGVSPFWECLGRHFFRMDFAEADQLSATTNNQFILDLMPKYPIYVDLLPAQAREVIGRCHADGVGAHKLLQWEGFDFDRTVDIFDGGPLVSAQRRHIRTIRESRLVTLTADDVASNEHSQDALISNDKLPEFRVTQGKLIFTGEEKMAADPDVLDALNIKSGDQVRVWLRSK